MRANREIAECRSAVAVLVKRGRSSRSRPSTRRSAPTLKYFPAASMSTARTSGVSSHSAASRLSSEQNGPSNGLPRSGWSSVMWPTPSTISNANAA